MPAETHVRGRGGGDTRGVADIVYDVVAEASGRAVAVLSDELTLASLGVTGLVLLDVVEAVGEELGERTVGPDIDDDDLAAVVSLGGLVELISEGVWGAEATRPAQDADRLEAGPTAESRAPQSEGLK